MADRVNYWLNVLIRFGVLILAVTTPFFFWTETTESFETPKFLILLVFTLLLLLLWSVKFLLEGKVRIIRTPLDLTLLLLLVAVIISTFIAPVRWTAILGSLPRVNGSAATWVTYILFYFLLVSNLRSVKEIKQIIYILVVGGVVLAVLGIMQFCGVFLPFSFAQDYGFTPTGSTFSTTALLTLLVPVLMQSVLVGKVQTKATSAAILTLFIMAIALLAPLSVQIITVVVVLLSLLFTPHFQNNKALSLVLVPVGIGILIAVFSHLALGTPSKNLLYNQAQKFPREVQLPFASSWQISISAFRDAPFFGTGPASYQTDFTIYKPLSFNNEKFWNVRFDQGYNEYLNDLATLGAVGLLAILIFAAVFISQAVRVLSRHRDEIGSALALSGITFFLLLAVHPATVVVWVVGLIILAGLMISHDDLTEELHLAVAAFRSSSSQLRFDILPVILLVFVIALVVGGLFFTGKFALADYYHRQGLVAYSQGQALPAYNNLVKAEQLNPYVEIYHTRLAQTNFAIANAIAAAKGPSESSPGGSLTDKDKQDIQTFLSQSINEGRVAVAINPRSATDWEVLGAIYRQISGVAQNALAFSLDAYGRAIQLDPLNPLLRLNAGGIYYSAKSYDNAVRFFTDTVQLKPDYANAWYNLAIALRDKGDLTNAVAAAERTVSLVDAKSKDYEVASQLLADLRSKTATGSANAQSGSQLTPAATQDNSALEKEGLPKVLNLPKPENVATPPAVKKSGNK
jgi:tetratricopeptide (TPR) repeat protein/O-antigen ligase